MKKSISRLKILPKIVTWVIVAGLIYVAYLYGGFQATWIPTLPCDKVQAEIDVYRACMQSVSKTRCLMQVDDFRKYYQLKSNLAERCNAKRSAIPQS